MGNGDGKKTRLEVEGPFGEEHKCQLEDEKHNPSGDNDVRQ